jgi:hypothetical protein
MHLHELTTPAVQKSPSKRLVVYTIVDRPGTDKSFWARIGSAWINRDQSINIQLDALPVNGKLHVREPSERPETSPRGT